MYSVCTVFEVRLFYCGYKFLTDINFHKVSAKKKKKKKKKKCPNSEDLFQVHSKEPETT